MLTDMVSIRSCAHKIRFENVVWPKALPIPHLLLDCADEVIEYQEETGPARGRRTEAVWVLWETTEWRRLPLQPTTSNGGALLTFAHCPNFKLRGVRSAPDGGYWPVSDDSGLVGKASNFEQTIAVHICCFANHRGIALSGPKSNATQHYCDWWRCAFPGVPIR
jgi:hypothetical protein